MPNYQNAKIYKLICSETNKVYIGSTVAKLKYRKSKHIHSNNKCTSKDFINPKIYLIEKYPCSNKEELHSKEREYIDSFDCVNKQLPGQTRKEYYENNKEKIKEEFKAYNKEYYEKNKAKIIKKSREYKKDNKEELNKKAREYKKDNKEELNKKAREKMTCKCGSIYNRSGKSQHLKSKKHQIFTIKNLI